MDSLQLEALVANTPDIIVALPWLGTVDLTRPLLALGVFAGLTLLFWLVRAVILVRLRSFSERTDNDVDDMIIKAVENIKGFFYSYAALYVALQLITLPERADTVLTAIFLFLLVWQLIAVATCVIEYGVRRFLEKDEDGDGVIDPNSATASEMISLLSKIVLWAFGGIFVLSNLGVEVTSLIAGLGIGGIAIAFALQGILSDLFSSFSLYFDKPFRIGDYIVIGEHSGTVEKIGIKTTRIRTLQGEELVVSNAELTSTRVQNFKKMQARRINFTFGITYDTPYDKVKGINGLIEDVFTKVEGARLDRVHFTTYGDSALMFEVIYFVESADYVQYLDAQQAVNFDIMERFAAEGIEFAYPTQTVYLKNS